MSRTLALFYPGCIEFEIMLACEILNAKFPVDVITPDGADHPGSNGMVFRAAGALADVDVAKYKCGLFPGGDPALLIGNETLIGILRAMNANGAVLGAICAGPIILEQAGLLKGRRIAHGYAGPQLEYLTTNGFFRETTLTSEAVIAEDNIVTARPDSFIDFAVEIACMTGAIDPARKTFWQNYYRGRP